MDAELEKNGYIEGHICEGSGQVGVSLALCHYFKSTFSLLLTGLNKLCCKKWAAHQKSLGNAIKTHLYIYMYVI